MKFFALIFLFGLATASFHDILDDSDEEDFILKAGHKKDKDDLQTELGRKLRETLDHILKEIKGAVHDGKGVSKELLDQAKDLVKKLKRYGVDVSDEAKDIVDYLKTRVERWAEELIDILNDNSTTVYRADDKVTEFGNKLRKALREVLHEIKKAVEEGRHVSQRLLHQAKDLISRLKKYGLDVSDEIKEMLEYLKTRISKWAEELLDVIRGKRNIVTDRIKELISRFNLEDKIKDLRKLLDGEGDISSKFEKFLQEHFSRSKVLMRKLRDYFEEGKDRLKSLLDKILKRETRSIIDKMKKKIEEFGIREKLENLKNMISEGVSNSKIKAFITETIPEKAGMLRKFLLDAFDNGKDKLEEILGKILRRNTGF